MRNILGIIIWLFVIMFIIDYRFGIPNGNTPEVSKRISGVSHPLSSLYDRHRTCHLWGKETYLTQKYGYDIERDDECLHCKKAWKWHYNK